MQALTQVVLESLEGDGKKVVIKRAPGCDWYYVEFNGNAKKFDSRFQCLEEIAKYFGGDDTRSQTERFFDVIGW